MPAANRTPSAALLFQQPPDGGIGLGGIRIGGEPGDDFSREPAAFAVVEADEVPECLRRLLVGVMGSFDNGASQAFPAHSATLEWRGGVGVPTRPRPRGGTTSRQRAKPLSGMGYSWLIHGFR